MLNLLLRLGILKLVIDIIGVLLVYLIGMMIGSVMLMFMYFMCMLKC